MNIDFERFEATDGVQLQGWYSDAPGDTAVVHVHGMSGNGYENRFLDNLRTAYNDAGFSFFTFNNRGSGISGSCFEIFSESANDIQGAIDFLKSKGKSKFILQGHSLGGSKVVNFLLTKNQEPVEGVVLFAPTDMVAWAATDPKNQEYLDKAHQLIAAGKPEELVGAQCWIDKTPLSAQTYPTISEKGTAIDIYSSPDNESSMGRVKIPMIIIYGDKDIGITEADGDIDAWKARASKAINSKTKIEVIPGANHSFSGFEDKLADIAATFIKALSEIE